ncbi:NgoMIV family type II restriction endonuclease [[Mycobacterium] crassicus]|uniref:NgoMIV family type II restriction endonuclease n=1 Tax=[Mycobacterium] crassicus TaxID=2872309 RepID=A0ABU5XGR0_9MYCO|nr:NgoMIV family type II restriction endonuclease [Mycolicibacter sp. MYC098]MEB3021486.1 NgoMIV family type II restriction endonuclease [Mycolicibacter sp. MYC098]
MIGVFRTQSLESLHYLELAGIVAGVPASFTSILCGYRRKTGKPNTSDSNDDLSVELGIELFDRLGIPRSKIAPDDPGSDMEEQIINVLKALRPDLRVERSRAAKEFSQYAHLAVFARFEKDFPNLTPRLDSLASDVLGVDLGAKKKVIDRRMRDLAAAAEQQMRMKEALVQQMPEESLLKIDISVAVPRTNGPDELAIALSSKWSLRTDRAQDCVSQGHKLVAQRRGKMPHFGVVTIEPRPSMLKILADGSGAIDFVYHLDLPALSDAIDAVAATRRTSWSPGRTFKRLITQNRLRDFEQLLREVQRIPGP